MGNPITPDVVKRYIDGHLAQLCEVSEVTSNVFRGRVTKSLMDAEAAQMMGSFDDYDNLKRPECMELGKKILDSIK